MTTDAAQMREAHGVGPEHATCESCVYLRATANEPRPQFKRKDPLTTFQCRQARARAPWSVIWPACGRYREA